MSDFLKDSQVNIIAGKNLVGHASKEDVQKLLSHIWALERLLDDEVDIEDFFGSEGWRNHVGIADD